MRVARLLLCYVLLEDYSTNLGRATITSDAARQNASATNPTLADAPSFAEPIRNVTAAIGKEAVLLCTIRRLGNYKVGWLRAEDQTILSMGQRTVTHSPRFHVSMETAKAKNQTQSRVEEETTWRLQIRPLQEADRGCYMCQVNTKPMLSQLGCVDVLVPPDILSTGTSEGEVSVSEGENATLSCKASGRPPPRVLWRREKSDSILTRGPHDQLIPVDSLSGEKLELTRVDRRQMGAYLCIARNEVPPAVSKRVYLTVNFPPSAKVPNQLLSSPLDTDVSLICLIEAYPKTINLWSRKEQVIMSGIQAKIFVEVEERSNTNTETANRTICQLSGRYEIDERTHPDEEWKRTIELKIRRLEKTDLGEYTCSASSSMGKAEATLRVYEIERVTLPTLATSVHWRKSNRGRSKNSQVTSINRVYHQVSTPAMHKSSVRFLSNKYLTTSTTVDPRAPLIKDKNAFKNHEDLTLRSSAHTRSTHHEIYAIFLLFLLTFR